MTTPYLTPEARPSARDAVAPANIAAAAGLPTYAAPELGRPLRILMSSYRSDPFTGGQGVYMYHLTKALADMGHTVDVISGQPYPVLDPRVRLIELPSLDLYARPKGFLDLPWPKRHEFRDMIDVSEWLTHISGGFGEPRTFGARLVRWMKAHARNYDVLHDNQTLTRGLIAIKAMGIPIAGTLHHPITFDRRIAVDAAETTTFKLLVRRWYSFLGMQIRVARQLSPIMVSSQSTARDVVTDFKLDPRVLRLTYLGVDVSSFHPYPEISRKQNRLMATASADVPLKGLVYLIRAYAQLLKTRPALELTVIGKLREGPTAKLLDELGIRGRVRFISGITNEEIAKLYAEATIAVAPSVYEGFGFPPAEAMACGVPVVSSDGGSLPEVVGNAGVIVPKKDPDALAAAIGALLDDPERRTRMSEAGRARVHERFLWSKTAEAVTAVYREAIHANRGA